MYVTEQTSYTFLKIYNAHPFVKNLQPFENYVILTEYVWFEFKKKHCIRSWYFLKTKTAIVFTTCETKYLLPFVHHYFTIIDKSLYCNECVSVLASMKQANIV
jgi:hypothetical protein